MGVAACRLGSAALLLAAVALGGCTSPRNMPLPGGEPDAAEVVDGVPPAMPPTGGAGGTNVPPADAARAEAGSGPLSAPDAARDLPGAPPLLDCGTGAHACGGTCVSETASSCGPTCMACPHPPNTEVSCMAGACAFACSPGFGSCGGGTPAAGGCLTDLRTDGANCGRCGRACGPCAAGICPAVMLASGLDVNEDSGGGDCFDGNELYWVGTDSIKAIAKTGGQPRVVLAKFVFAIGVLGNTLVYSAQSPPHTPTYEVVRMPAAGGAGQRLGMASAPVFNFGQGGDSIYWWGWQDATMMTFDIERASFAGGPTQNIASGPLPRSGSESVVFDASGAYWQQEDLPGELRWRPASGTATTFYKSDQPKDLLTTDADYLYWTEGNQIVRGRKGAAVTSPEILADAGDFPTYIEGTINGDDLFLFAFKEQIAVIPRNGGPLRMLVPPDEQARWQISTGVDDKYVYWIGKGGKLWRVPR